MLGTTAIGPSWRLIQRVDIHVVSAPHVGNYCDRPLWRLIQRVDIPRGKWHLMLGTTAIDHRGV